MRGIQIVGLSILAAVLYGICHDQITARVCVEYFTIGHPPVFDTEDPTLLAFGWGVIATWWVGLILGVPLALCARVGSRPALTPKNLIRPLSYVLVSMGALSLVAGVVGTGLAKGGSVWLLEPLASRVPTEKHVAFLGVLWAHNAAYLAGFVGGIVLCVWTWRWRGKPNSPLKKG